MSDKRVIETVLAGRETISDAARKAERGLGDLRDEMRDTEQAAGHLDKRIGEINGSLKDLAHQYARTGDEAFIKQIRAQEAELRKVTKARSLLGDIVKDGEHGAATAAAEVGATAGTRFAVSVAAKAGELLPRALARGGPVMGGAALAALPAAVFLGSTVGAAVAGAMSAAISTGVVAGGVALALRDPLIKNAAARAGKDMLTALTDAAAGFKQPVMDAITTISATFKQVLPDIKDTFDAASTFVEPLAAGLSNFIREVVPAIKRTVQHAAPIFDVIEHGIGAVGSAIADVLDSLNDNGRELAAGLAFAFGAVSVAIRTVGAVLNATVETFGFFMDQAFQAIEVFGQIGRAMQKIPGTTAVVGRELVDVAEQTKGVKAKWDEWSESAVAGTSGVTSATGTLTIKQQLLNSTMGDAIKIAGNLKGALDELTGGYLSARGAQSNYEAAVDNLTDSLKRNGQTLNLDTEAGRANDAAVRALIDTVAKRAELTYNTVLKATGDETAAQKAANKVIADGGKQLQDTLGPLGRNTKAGKAYAAALRNIPTSWKTSVKLNGYEAVIAKARTLRSVLAGISAGASLIAGNRFGGVYEHAQVGALREAQVYSPRSPARYAFAEPATGGEAFIPKRGPRGRAATILQKAASWYGLSVGQPGVPPVAAVGGGGGGPTVVRFVSDGSRASDLIVELIRHTVRVEGRGDVQLAFGGRG